MSERIPTLKNEATRESGLVVPGEYGEANEATRPEIILPTEQEVRLYNKSRNETKEEKAEIADHQAYEEIIKPINVLHLKEAIDHAQGELGTKSANVNSGRNLSKEASAIREEYIAEYLQTGNKRDLPRPIPHEIRTQLEDLLKMSYRQLEALLGESEENQENIQPDDEPENSTENESNPKNSPEDSLESDGPEEEQAQEKQDESEPDDNHEDEPDGDDDPEEEPTKKHEVDEGEEERERLERRKDILERIEIADAIDDKDDRIRALKEIGEDSMQSDPDLAICAAHTMKNSQAHKGMKAKKVGRTKKFGVQNSAYNQLMLDISNANSDNEFGIKAAEMIDMPWLRNETLAQRSTDSVKRIAHHYRVGGGYKENYYGGADSFGPNSGRAIDAIHSEQELDDLARSLMSGRFGKKYSKEFSFERAKQLLDLDVASSGLRFIIKRQELIMEVAVEASDKDLARTIKLPWIRKEALKRIDKNLVEASR